MNRTRTLALLALLLTLLVAACSQAPEDVAPPRLEPQFGTRGGDTVEDVAFHKNGYLYAVGTWNSDSYYYGTGDAYLRRYDRSGNMMWETFFDAEEGYEYYDQKFSARAVAADSSGNAYVGWTADYYVYDYDYGYYDHASFNYLSKYDKNGAQKYKVYTTSSITDLAVDGSGNVYTLEGNYLKKYTATGGSSWSRYLSAAPTSVTVSGSGYIYLVRQDGVVMKYSSSGSALWTKAGSLDGYIGHPYEGTESGYKIVAGPSELYVVGEVFYDWYDYEDDSCFVTYSRLRLYKLSGTGARQWSRDAASGYNDSCENDGWSSSKGPGVAADSYGNAYIVGGVYKSSSYDINGFAAKYTRTGSRSWFKEFGTQKVDAATSAATYDGTELFVGGMTYGYLNHKPLGNGDAFLRKMDKNGNRIWTR